MKKLFKQKMKEQFKKGIAMYLVVSLLFEIMAPTYVLALTGGPSQPEVQNFTPIGTSDMVDLFSGDFTYNIPLLDVDGYPINISYTGGISMDQEASWVGLGWNINPGVVNRAMRGLPDDFNGDEVRKTFKSKPNVTFGVKGAVGFELFGLDEGTMNSLNSVIDSDVELNLNFGIGLSYNNYTGIGIERTMNSSITSAGKAKGKLNGSLGLNSSSSNGLSVQPSIGFTYTKENKEKTEYKSLGGKLGASFNSRMGLQQLSFGVTAQASYENITDSKKDKSGSEVAGGVTASFDLGMPTYTPDADLPLNSFSATASFKFGPSLFGNDITVNASGYVSVQKLRENTRVNHAYGYMNSDQGQNDSALLDFNRENDGSFMPTTPNLAVSNFTYDLFSVSGQGVGGSYRPFRNEVGHIFDPSNETTSNSGSLGLEFGTGNLFKGGVDVNVTHIKSTSGNWTDNNQAGGTMKYKSNQAGNLKEKFYFKEANEKSVNTDQSFYSQMGGENPVRFDLVAESKFNTYADDKLINQDGGFTNINTNERSGREKRNQVISVLTHNEMKAGAGIESLNALGFDNGAIGHHIAEITSLGADGRRYVYGIAAYNTYQEETSFAIGSNQNGNGGTVGSCNTGLVNYIPETDNSLSNERGLDYFYNSTEMPAYAHSYLLTSVLSPDYVDADNIKGPSDGDLGTWIKFNYEKVEDYKWRTPVQGGYANYNEGLKSDPSDDKANYVYGEKELWYVTSIETKNYIAVFELEERKDGYGVAGRNGGINSSNKKMKVLRKISLFSKTSTGVNPIPIKEVHFEYDYSLCPNNPNNIDFVNGETDPAKTGKLTLTRIFFTYQNSNKAKFSPYKFEYNGLNPEYNIKAYDRWGNFKPNAGVDCDALSGGNPSTAEFPYVEQKQSTADQYTSAWSLTDVFLPSGGKIHVDYESDDYAYVQHKKASQMFKIVGVGDDNNTSNMVVPGNTASLSDEDNKSRLLFFELQPGYTNLDDYFGGMQYLYFRCLAEFSPGSGGSDGRHDYVSGYAEIADYGLDATGNYGWVQLNPVSLNDGNTDTYNPITKASIQFGRMHLSRYIWNQPNVADGEGFGADVLNAIMNSGFAENIGDAISGPNKSIWLDGKGRKIVLNKSWIRLFNPNQKKLGGGCRVKKISMSDEWGGMTSGDQADSYSYGQQYDYRLEDGTSSGVASYEPQIGGDENTFKQPVFFTNDDPTKKIDNLLTPREDFYQEEPLGESFYPSASVGYSRVTVKNIERTGVTRTATGRVIHEFYTAKDFPTITNRTEVKPVHHKNNPFSVQALFNINSKDHMTVSQGFVVELNDMHGKPKKQMVYQENQDEPITSVEYFYESEEMNLDGELNYRLINTATVIHPNGQTGNAEIGVFFDMVADMRENKTNVIGGGINLNIDGFLAAILPVVVPIPYPSVTKEETQFRSAATTKVINRFGILKETIAKDLGSQVSTRNLAYDSETGEVLLTQTTTDFNDDIYSLTYPSHWFYDGMGQAYKNIGYRKTNVTFNGNGMTSIPNAHLFFSEGDEVILFNKLNLSYTSQWFDDYTAPGIKAWVSDATTTGIKLMDKEGTIISGGPYSIKVIRSGRRNMQAVPIASITSLKNPLDQFSSNIFENVLQSSAMEFSEDWNTFCDCFEDPMAANFTTNPYVLGTKGNWRMKRSWLHLSPRTQSNYDDNTNIRKDGMFTSYTPFYKLVSSKWNIDERNWTFTSEVTEFSPFGQELENRDALGRFSAATFGFNQSLATAVAANSRYRELGFDSFEDYGFADCFDDHFKFKDNPDINEDNSHTGRNSIKVSVSAPAVMTKVFENCEPEKCTLAISDLLIGAGSGAVATVSGGTAAYQIDFDIVNGNPAVNIDNTGTQISITGTGYSINFTITDATGCKVLKTITRN